MAGPQVKVFKCGFLVHPYIYWMGCSPDGIFYDLTRILEIKSLFSMRGKSAEECLDLKRDICIHRNKNGEISLKHNHTFSFLLSASRPNGNFRVVVEQILYPF